MARTRKSDVETLVAVRTAVNGLRTYLADGMLAIATVIASATATRWKTTTTLIYTIAGAIYSIAATDSSATVFTTAGTINTAGASGTGHWGAWLVQADATKTLSTKAPGGGTTDQDYATEALAKAAAIALGPDAGKVQVAIITVQGLASTAWTAGTSNLTVGSGAGNVTARNFYDLPAVKALPDALATA